MDKHAFISIDLTELFNLVESTIQDLEKSTITGFPFTTKRQHAIDPVRIVQMKYIPYVQNKVLKVESLANSNGKNYDVVMQFADVEYQEADSPKNITFVAVDNEKYHVTPLSATTDHAQVRCTCLDFYYRFAVWNFNDGSLYGDKPPLYKRKTTTRPPANPNQTPGICKHIWKSAVALNRAGLMRRI